MKEVFTKNVIFFFKRSLLREKALKSLEFKFLNGLWVKTVLQKWAKVDEKEIPKPEARSKFWHQNTPRIGK